MFPVDRIDLLPHSRCMTAAKTSTMCPLGISRAKKQCFFLKLNGIAWIAYGVHTGMASGEALLAAFEAFALGGENGM